jgi:hypothetical protein
MDAEVLIFKTYNYIVMEEKRGKNTNNTLAELKKVMADIKAGKFSSDGYSNAVKDIEEDISELERCSKPITLEQAAIDYHNTEYGIPKDWTPIEHLTERQHANNIRIAFKVGAQWQKEQNKELMRMARNMILAYDHRYPTESDLLAGITNQEAIDKLNNFFNSEY